MQGGQTGLDLLVNAELTLTLETPTIGQSLYDLGGDLVKLVPDGENCTFAANVSDGGLVTRSLVGASTIFSIPVQLVVPAVYTLCHAFKHQFIRQVCRMTPKAPPPAAPPLPPVVPPRSPFLLLAPLLWTNIFYYWHQTHLSLHMLHMGMRLLKYLCKD